MKRSVANRIAGTAGLAWGCVLLARGARVFERIEKRPPSSAERRAIAVLGARHSGQGILQWAMPGRCGTLWIGVDLTHAASMLILAIVSPTRRHVALVSAGVAAVAALVAGSGRGR